MPLKTFQTEIRAMETPAARRLAIWRGVEGDLRRVLKLTERIRPMLDNTDAADQTLLHAYSSAASVAYARCFVGGSRAHLSASAVYANYAGPDPLGWHEYLMQTRHKHVAHADGVFEEVVVACLLDPEGEVVGVQSALVTRTADSIDGVGALAALARHAHAHVTEKIKTFSSKLIEEASAMSVAQRLALPVARNASILYACPASTCKTRAPPTSIARAVRRRSSAWSSSAQAVRRTSPISSRVRAAARSTTRRK